MHGIVHKYARTPRRLRADGVAWQGKAKQGRESKGRASTSGHGGSNRYVVCFSFLELSQVATTLQVIILAIALKHSLVYSRSLTSRTLHDSHVIHSQA